MADKPILFSAPMVRALLAGTKTQTRRILKTDHWAHESGKSFSAIGVPGQSYAVGDRLWLREAYFQRGHWRHDVSKRTVGGKEKWAFIPESEDVLFDEPPEGFYLGRSRLNQGRSGWYKRLGRFMPRTASRLTLAVTEVRVQRLQDISEADALADGVVWSGEWQGFVVPGIEHPNKDFPVLSRPTAREMFAALWDVVNGSGAWLSNPWIVALTFDVRKGNIDG